jgi:hypothetical protein
LRQLVPPEDEAAMAQQMTRRYGDTAVLRADGTATALHAMGDEKGAARWRRIRDLIHMPLACDGT